MYGYIMGICRCIDKNYLYIKTRKVLQSDVTTLIALKLKYILWLIAKLSRSIVII